MPPIEAGPGGRQSTADAVGPVRTVRAVCDGVRQRKLLRAARRGDRGARERLVRCHLALVRDVASRYRELGLPYDDLVQEGSIGLLDAIDHYEPSRGPSFDAYARYRVRRAIRNALTEQARLIRLPKQIVERRRALDRAEALLTAAGRRPTPSELAAETGLTVGTVLEARNATSAPVSLDAPAVLDGSPLEALVADLAATDPEAETLALEQTRALHEALGQLPARKRRVVVAQWGLAGTREASAVELANELALSPRRTQTITRDALAELREMLEPAEATP